MSKSKQQTTANVSTKTLHQQLQAIAAAELARLPEFLEQLTPAERVRTVLQLLPYTAPKVEKVTTTYGEGWGVEWD